MNTTKESIESKGISFDKCSSLTFMISTQGDNFWISQIVGSWNTTCWKWKLVSDISMLISASVDFSYCHFLGFGLQTSLRKRCSVADNVANWMGSWFHMFTPAAWLKCVESVAFVAFKARLRILTILLSGALATFVACIGVCPAEAGVGESTPEDTCQVFRWQDFCILDFNLQTFDVARTSDSDPACVCHIH